MTSRRNATDIWAGAKVEDIGSGFTILDEEEDSSEASLKKFGTFKRNPFITISSTLIPLKVAKKIRTTPVTKITTKESQKFSSSTKKHIEDINKFFLDELLPLTASVDTAFLEIDDRLKQLLGDSPSLPKEFFKQKILEAINLKMIDFISSKLSLSPEDRKSLTEKPVKEPKWPSQSLETMLQTYLKTTSTSSNSSKKKMNLT